MRKHWKSNFLGRDSCIVLYEFATKHEDVKAKMARVSNAKRGHVSPATNLDHYSEEADSLSRSSKNKAVKTSSRYKYPARCFFPPILSFFPLSSSPDPGDHFATFIHCQHLVCNFL